MKKFTIVSEETVIENGWTKDRRTWGWAEVVPVETPRAAALRAFGCAPETHLEYVS